MTQKMHNMSYISAFNNSLNAMTVFGLGEICGSILIGFAIDKTTRKKVFFFNMLALLVQGVSTYIFLIEEEFGTKAYFMSFFFGLYDGILNTHLLQMLGFIFINNYDPYAVLSIVQSLTIFVVIMLLTLLATLKQMIYFSLVYSCIGVISFMVVIFFNFKDYYQPRALSSSS